MFVITLTQGIYNYIPETNHVSVVYNFAAVLYLQFLLHVMLFRMLNMFCAFKSVLPEECVQCPIWLFFFVVPWCHAFTVCGSGTVWVILKWFHLPLLLLALLLHLQPICAQFLLYYYYYYYCVPFQGTGLLNIIITLYTRYGERYDCSCFRLVNKTIDKVLHS
jgi:hypothetical protein